MTLQEQAQRVLLAKAQGDLRYQEFIERLAQRTGVHPMECELRTMMLAQGFGIQEAA